MKAAHFPTKGSTAAPINTESSEAALSFLVTSSTLWYTEIRLTQADADKTHPKVDPFTMIKSLCKANRSQWLQPVLALVVFVVALFPRAIYPVSRPAQWYTRSVMFMHSVVHGDWEETVYSEHPGVTTMWLSGLALRLAGVTPEERSEGPYVDPDSLTARESAIGVLSLALAIATLVALIYLLLARLFDRTAAFGAATLIALDPFFIANSKVLHVDALLAALMSSSALALLVYVSGASERRQRWVIVSGALAGLALLTKSPALFLLPYAALCLGVDAIADHIYQRRKFLASLFTALRAGLAWLTVLGLVYFALFPAMWGDPIGTIRTVYRRASLRISWPHPNPIYFLGHAFVGDPGPTYYLYTWTYKITPVVSVFALVALLHAGLGKTVPYKGAASLPSIWKGKRSDSIPHHKRTSIALMLAFILFFTIQMMLGAKKMPRYLLPAFPVADALAGVGLAWWASRIPWLPSPSSGSPPEEGASSACNISPSNSQLPTSDTVLDRAVQHGSSLSTQRVAKRLPSIQRVAKRLLSIQRVAKRLLLACLPQILVVSGLLLQAVLVLPRHPYYDTYFNTLAGGAQAGVAAISTQWQGEGLDIAAQRLNQLPDAAHQVVGSHKTVAFQQYFIGQTVGVDEPADWYVLGINNVLKAMDREEDQVVDFYRRRRAWDTVDFDGIPYAWIYRAATGPQTPTAFTFQCEARSIQTPSPVGGATDSAENRHPSAENKHPFDSGIQLVGYDIAPPQTSGQDSPSDACSPHHPSQTLQLQLYWQAREPQKENYTVFVHMISCGKNGGGQLVTQQDNQPVRGTRPTSTWEPGTVITDPYDLSIPKSTPPGEYALTVGLYRWQDGSRLSVYDPACSNEGKPLPDDRIVLTTVTVERKRPSPRVWAARGLASLVLLSAVIELTVLTRTEHGGQGRCASLCRRRER